MIRDKTAAIAAREAETAGLVGDSDLGADKAERVAAIAAEITELKAELAELETEWATEQKLVNEIRDLRDILNPPKESDGKGKPAGQASAAPGEASAAPATAEQASATDPKDLRDQLRQKFETLEARDPEKRMMYAFVDEQVVASVVSDWTGIPVGRMVKDDIENVLRLP